MKSTGEDDGICEETIKSAILASMEDQTELITSLLKVCKLLQHRPLCNDQTRLTNACIEEEIKMLSKKDQV